MSDQGALAAVSLLMTVDHTAQIVITLSEDRDLLIVAPASKV
jgi:hypothetical protein